MIEFDPETMEFVWQYAGTAERPLESLIRASQQRLANGNTLITESSGGRVLEVTPAGEIVWQFVNPARGGAQGELLSIVCWAQRLDPNELDPALFSEDFAEQRSPYVIAATSSSGSDARLNRAPSPPTR